MSHVAHYNPEYGQLGQNKTLNHVMAHVFWPGICSNMHGGCFILQMSVGESTSHPKSHCFPFHWLKSPSKEFIWTLSDIRKKCKRVRLCISSGGLCNVISKSHASIQHLCTQCCKGTIELSPKLKSLKRFWLTRASHSCHVWVTQD